MPWIQLKLNATSETAEPISELLQDSGALAVTFLDAHDTPIFEPLPGETRLWGNTDIVALYEADQDLFPIVEALKLHPIMTPDFAWKVEQLEDKDWEREWMDNFHPMKFGKRLWICPSWRDVPDESAVNVMLDPGLAFGTGTHPTTHLCLEWLESLDLAGKTVIDFGCGSGILAIAALKLGAAKVIGIDIDPQAITASLDNASRNNVADKIELYLAKDQPEGLLADVVVANILAGPLRELFQPISALVKPQGLLGLSGILEQQADELNAVYKAQFNMDSPTIKDEWARLSGQKI
ncbi:MULTISPECIES: 50S ribosomal protein L11 methyltransferase [unclassified Motilimonas]|uniref:50S ribosomal protein L11 methyltransferase n=1 Tax=Motilimonas TaxID=1914248 RepID=UPI001E5C8374|nr:MULTISPECIES: 50S ribosomal protein L11 methyltransferase [unclassified Motilimonas]MCE0555645.1 50S ribosomal protein L11 methyltransferase [Motilimonas sp. E26]MDO6526679.1 50S ribosomal protein L11 methyltransferase [Motilimonas sp. 1_MG-2023]